MCKKIPSLLDFKNSLAHADWAWRWHAQGGSRHFVAHPMKDLRNAEQLELYSKINAAREKLQS